MSTDYEAPESSGHSLSHESAGPGALPDGYGEDQRAGARLFADGHRIELLERPSADGHRIELLERPSADGHATADRPRNGAPLRARVRRPTPDAASFFRLPLPDAGVLHAPPPDSARPLSTTPQRSGSEIPEEPGTGTGTGTNSDPVQCGAVLRRLETPAISHRGHVGPASLLDRLCAGQAACALIFAGQGIPYLLELRELERQSLPARTLIHAAAARIDAVMARPDFRRSGLYTQGFDLLGWLRDDRRCPDPAYLASSVISQALVLLVQAARYASLYDEGLGQAIDAGAVLALTGHSQGVMAALLVAEQPGGRLLEPRVSDFVEYYLYQGLHMQRAFGGLRRGFVADGDATPMAAVSRIDLPVLEEAVAAANRRLPDDARIFITLKNTRTRNVVSGPARSLAALRTLLEARADQERKDKQQGRFAGRPAVAEWEYLPVSAAFHSPYMAEGLERMRETVKALDFRLEASRLQLPVLSPGTGEPLNDAVDLTETLLTFQFLEPVAWERTLHRLAEIPGLTHVLDLGPGDAVARLSGVCLRGSGVRVLPLALPTGRRSLLGEAEEAPELDYRDFLPRLARLPDGRLRIDNRYTRFTGRPPVFLPGMTPTTADVPIVAAAASGGFVAELAGGGQVTEAIFRLRMEELERSLPPGLEVVFNALYLDPYLWGLHFRDRNLVLKLKREGAPLCGVTISAGIPEPEEATRLLDGLEAAGLWLNAFKPGTTAQIEAVLRIAAANPQRTLLMHLEGGRAGGHHSWEDLDQLLLESYHRIRAQRNLVLCVGGGVGDEARAVALLTGDWATRYGQRPMPVDAVFPGTVAMACLEAGTSPQVKSALVEAAGTGQWVYSGRVDGGVTSGKSSLNADIYYLDNAASRCGRLLDGVAGDAAAVAARKDEIVAALNATAKPYFGDLDGMSYLEVLQRMVALMAIGRGGRYEDGIWPDRSFRERVADFLRRAEARLCEAGEGEVASILGSLAELDDPASILERFAVRYPAAAATPLHPLDVRYFLFDVCARPGKPVNFVPVIDADVRRWYKADSLWQSHDDRFDADQVLAIPGPEAVRGIRRPDEPVAALLGRFENALIERLLELGVVPEPRETLTAPRTVAPLPPGCHVSRLADGVERIDVPGRAAQSDRKTFASIDADGAASADPPVDVDAWFTGIGSRYRGPLARLFLAPTVLEGRRCRPNPLRQLCPPVRGAALEVTTDAAGVATSIRYSSGSLGETVHLRRIDGAETTLELDVRPHTVAGGSDHARLQFPIRCLHDGGAELFLIEPAAWSAAVRSFYQRALFGRTLEGAALLETATVDACVSVDDAEAYAAITGGVAGESVPHHMAFTLAWEGLFQVLSSEALAGGLLRLVHLSNRFEPMAGWPLRTGEAVAVEAGVVRVENSAQGRTITTRALLSRAGEPCMAITSAFFVRDSFAGEALRVQAREPLDREIRLVDEAAAAMLATHPRVALEPDVTLTAGDRIVVAGTLAEARPWAGKARYGAEIRLLRDSREIGRVEFDLELDAAMHPVRALLEALSPPVPSHRETPRKRLAAATVHAPARLETFAEVGRDGNPIHVSPLMARLAGLEGPIVHGMWTSARAYAFLVEHVAEGDAARVGELEAEFLAPALPGERMSLTAARVGVKAGGLVVEVLASALREGGGVPLLRARARVAPPRTAYVFPGQGIQQQGMGMDGYARSAAARAVWDRADAYTRAELGFSLLRVVRENPRDLRIDGVTLCHAQGVLHLTQLTQVAMAVLAQAQVAELREADVLADDALTCGHSVGEYNAIAAFSGVLSLETVIYLVYQRGCTMHRLVPRDAHGESGFRMGVIRPHLAGLDEAGAEALVARVREGTGLPLEIVNYNIRGRQYSVTGRREALARLEALLAERGASGSRGVLERGTPGTPGGSERGTSGGRGAYIEVPGIDTPFHSTLLRSGVAAFRKALEARLPATLPHRRLVGRYVPNLVPKAFSLEREYLEEVAAYTGSTVLAGVLADYAQARLEPDRLARTLLIELLSWQFASPVRWIETQELLFRPVRDGGLGAARLVEIGVGYQPTLANMARASLQGLSGRASIEVLNVEAERAAVFELEGDAPALDAPPVAGTSLPMPEPPLPLAGEGWGEGGALSARSSLVGSPAPSLDTAAAISTATPAAPGIAVSPSAPTAPGTVVSPAAPKSAVAAVSASSTPDTPVTVDEALRMLLALQARVRPEQVASSETIDQLFDGVSSRRNQVLLDLGAEFGVGAIDGAHEKPIVTLAQEIARRASSWQAPGKYTRAAQDEALARVFGRAGMTRRDVTGYLEKTWGLGPGLTNAALNTLTLATRPGTSARGGALGDLSGVPASSRAEAEGLIDQAVALLGTARGLTLARPGASSGAAVAAVDAAVVEALAERVVGPEGALMRAARHLAAELGHRLEPEAPAAADPGGDGRLERFAAEHGAAYEALIAPGFSAKKHVVFGSAWASARRDVARLYFEGIAGRLEPEALRSEALRLAGIRDPRCAATARWYAARAWEEAATALAEERDRPVADAAIPADAAEERSTAQRSMARRATAVAEALEQVAAGGSPAPVGFVPVRPVLEMDAVGAPVHRETADRGDGAMARFVGALGLGTTEPALRIGVDARANRFFEDLLGRACLEAFDFHGRTALVTGAGPGSIAVEVVRHLLRGGARVVVTTSTYGRERLRFYRALYERCAVPGAELHVVPFNQASIQDVQALTGWLFETVTEQVGATVRVVKKPFVPDLVLPFAALGELATLDRLEGRSLATLRAMLLSVELLIGSIASRLRDAGASAPCHVIVPFSPNHGGFGGDGLYAECKAGLEVLLQRWRSEWDAWGRFTTLSAARIGWVRGTGLMSANDAVAARLEASTGVRTFSTGEMGFLLAALCAGPACEMARHTPLEADLTGGFGAIADLRATVSGIRSELEVASARSRRLTALRARELELLAIPETALPPVRALPGWGEPISSAHATNRGGPDQQMSSVGCSLDEDLPCEAGEDGGRRRPRSAGAGRSAPRIAALASLSDTVVIVGAGEIGPWGSARTRFEIEVDDQLSPAGVLELAWMTGLVRFDDNDHGGAWIDAETGQPVLEHDIARRYRDAVRSRAGIRFIEPGQAGFDPEALEVLAPVFVEHDLSFGVGSEAEARAFLQRDPEHTRIQADPARGGWKVTRLKGATIHVPRQARLPRRVAGQIPAGFDFTRYGIPQDMVDNVDRITLFNLVATVDAFLSAGVTPEDLLRWVHPARIANTQGAGIGGMRSLRRLYTDFVLGRPRQPDMLQETLINVVAGYVVQSYVGSYGSMSHPVGACATAAVSVEEGVDKILAGKADLVVAGGFDDLGLEGAIGFFDMNATADTDEMAAMGLEPGELSRANDLRRRGFVEAHGGGTLLLARGDVAVRLGLPVLGVVAYAASFGDGIQKSVPAPGLGILACAAGGSSSPLARALDRFGLTADDIALVYKHDTSTAANDPNENALHHQIQQALGRSEGNPLFVVSQKTLTGHAKGGAAAWQLIGLCQALEQGVIPGNRNLDCVDPAMERFSSLAFTAGTLRAGKGRLKAGLVTSLGFGHVGAIVLVLHPEVFERRIPASMREGWLEAVAGRQAAAARRRAELLMGRRPAYAKRTHRRFEAADGTDAQQAQEVAMLIDAGARLDPASGTYVLAGESP